MKYLKTYNEAKRRFVDKSPQPSFDDKIKVLEACYPLSNDKLMDIYQVLMDDYSDILEITDSIKYTNQKMSGPSTAYYAFENYIQDWRKDKVIDGPQLYCTEDEFDDIWDRYNETSSKIGTMIYLNFSNIEFTNWTGINDIEHEIIKITKKIKMEVGEGVEFDFDWNYPEVNSLRTHNKPVSDYTLFISYKKVGWAMTPELTIVK